MYYDEYDLYDDYGNLIESDSETNSDMTIDLFSDQEDSETDLSAGDSTEVDEDFMDEEVIDDLDDEVRVVEDNLAPPSPLPPSNIIEITSEDFVDNEAIEVVNNENEENKHESTYISSTQVDSENCCIICTEMWTNSEDHHVVSLKCGHLFGKSCIETWLSPSRRTNRCPQCNKPAKKRDVHKIYARCIKPLDTWERDEALSKVKFWQDKSKTFEDELLEIKAKYSLLVKENDKLKLELMNSVMKNTLHKSISTVNSRISDQRNQSQMFKIVPVKDFDIREGGCRLHCYSKLIEALAISVRNVGNTNSVFPKFGVKKFPLEYSKSELIFIHNKPIKDMVINQYDATLLTVSLDKTLKITSLISKSIVSSINLTNEPWSVYFDAENNLIFTGLKNGDVIAYDKRNSNKELLVLSSTTKSPVVSLSNIEYLCNDTKYLGLMSTQLDTCTMYQFENSNHLAQSNYKSLKLPFEGKFSSSHFDMKSGLFLLSCRPSQKHQKVTHYTFDCNSDEQLLNLAPNIVNVFEGGNEQIHLSRSKIFTSPCNEDLVLVCAGDEGTNGALIWDCKSAHSQRITTQQPVLDFELIENQSSPSNPMLSCLSDNKVKLFKIC